MNILSKKILILLVLTGLMLSLLMGYILYNKESHEINLELQKDVREKVFSLEREFLLNFETLYSIKGLFIGSSFVSSSEFKLISSNILLRHKNIQALEWIPKVLHKDRSSYEKNRKNDFKNFEITQILNKSKMQRAQERKVYFPVSYVEPYIGNEIALGFDLASNEKRLKTLEESMNSGKILSTKSITLVQDTLNQKAFLTFLPIYSSSKSMIKDSDNLKGFILGVFKISDMFNTAMKRVKTNGINLLLIDKTDLKGDLLYSDFDEKSFESNLEFYYEKELMQLAGRNIILKAFATKNYIKQRRTATPYLATLVSIIFILFGALYIYFINQRKNIVEQIVKKRTQELKEVNEKLEFLSKIDTLTNIANRRYFDEYLNSQWSRAVRDKTPISLIMIDIDYFKLYNDNYGHPEGDICLKKVSDILKNTLKRDSDLIARYGGEEFIIVLPNTNEPLKIANDCLESIKKAKIGHTFSKISKTLSISIGTTTIIPTTDTKLKDFLINVDKALYDAKNSGRNKICIR